MSANPIGDWYDEQARKAAELSEQLRLARIAGATAEEIRRLERRELAGQPPKKTVSSFVALRDHHAGQAMASYILALHTSPAFRSACISEAGDFESLLEDYIADRCYDWAEAMVKAKERRS